MFAPEEGGGRGHWLYEGEGGLGGDKGSAGTKERGCDSK